MGRKYQVISADGHVEVPPELWLHHVPAKYKEFLPKLVRHDNGSEWWQLDGVERDNSGNLVSELDYDLFKPSTTAYHNMDGSLRPGCGGAVQRLKEQDKDNIDAEVLYPPVYLGAFFRPMIAKNKDAYLEIIKAYNTFLGEEFCSVAPDRLIGNAMVPETSVADGIKEMERCRKMGMISVSLSKWPNGGDTYKPETDDRYFEASLDLGMRLSPHVGFGGMPNMFGENPSRFGGPQPISTTIGIGGVGGSPAPTGQAIFYGLFDRMPKLKFYFAETQGGWLPHYMNWTDEFYQRWYPYWDVKLKKLPSQYIRDHCRFSFIADRLAMKFREDIGLDLLMWGSDFPHSVGTAPYSKQILEELFEGVPANERRQVLVENPCTFFGLNPNKDITPTPK